MNKALCCALVALSAAVVGCGPGSPGSSAKGGGTARRSSAAERQPISFLAASSTTDALEEIREQFSAETGYEVELNLGGSSTLANQIDQGAEADLFLSANVQWADFVGDTNQRSTHRVAKRVDLLSNRLVVVVPKDSKLMLAKLEDLTGNAVENLSLANPDSVPAGIYAREALQAADLWDKLEQKVVAGENVRTALSYIETRNAQAGIVYRTDALVSEHVRIVLEVDPALHTPVKYPLLLLRHGSKHPGAVKLYEYLAGPQAGKVFAKYGFTFLPDVQNVAAASRSR